MTAEPSQVLITGAPENLPPDVRSLIDPKQPLPPDVRFFEPVASAASIEWMVGAGLGLLLLGSILIFAGFPIPPIAFLGIASVAGGGWIMYRARSRMQRIRARREGNGRRYGIFLAGDRLIKRNKSGTTVIPRSQIPAIEADTVYYLVNDDRKSLQLPMQIVGMSAQSMLEEIHRWYADR